MEKIIYKEDFNINELIRFAEEHYPKFYEEFVLSFDSVESMEVSIKLAINIENKCYKRFDYYNNEFYYYHNIIRDLGINYDIYKNELEFREDYYNERKLEIEFLNFYCNLKRRNKKLYLTLKKNGITDKQMYDECFISSDGEHINYDINKLVKKYENIYK